MSLLSWRTVAHTWVQAPAEIYSIYQGTGIGQLAEPGRPHWSMLRLAMESPADWAIAPVQDLLGLGAEARLNTPGASSGQWTWRLDALPPGDLADELRRLAESTDRGPKRGAMDP